MYLVGLHIYTSTVKVSLNAYLSYSVICVYIAKNVLHVQTRVSFQFQGTCTVTIVHRNKKNKPLTHSVRSCLCINEHFTTGENVKKFQQYKERYVINLRKLYLIHIYLTAISEPENV